MGKAFTEDEKIEIGNAIIESATQLFKEQAYKDVKVDMIAKKVGIGKGTIYLFYPSKEHIFIDVIMKFEANLHHLIEDEVKLLETTKDRLRASLKIGLMETKDNQIYHAISDKAIMSKIFSLLNPEQMAHMASADTNFLEQLLKDESLKVEMTVALDLLRGVFFMKLFEDQLLSSFDVFVDHYIEAVLNQII